MYHDIKVVINISGRFALDKGMEGRLGKNFIKRVQDAGFIDVKDKSGNGCSSIGFCRCSFNHFFFISEFSLFSNVHLIECQYLILTQDHTVLPWKA